MPLPDCLCPISFSRYSLLSLQVVEKPNKCISFLTPNFFWKGRPQLFYGTWLAWPTIHNFSGRTTSTVWQSWVDRQIQLGILERRFAITDAALAWFHSYLSDRSYVIHSKAGASNVISLARGVPQGSVLGPKTFTAYTEEIDSILSQHGIHHHGYADDTQAHLAVRMHRLWHHGYRSVLKMWAMWVFSVAPGDSNWTRTKLKSCSSDHQCHYMGLQGLKKRRLWKRQCSACRLCAKPWCTSRQSTWYARSCHKDDTSMFFSVTTSPTGLPPTWSWCDCQLGCRAGVHVAWLQQRASCRSTPLVNCVISARHQCCSQARQWSVITWPCHSSGDRPALVTCWRTYPV